MWQQGVLRGVSRLVCQPILLQLTLLRRFNAAFPTKPFNLPILKLFPHAFSTSHRFPAPIVNLWPPGARALISFVVSTALAPQHRVYIFAKGFE